VGACLALFWDGADVNDHGPKIWWDGKETLFHFSRGRDENIIRTSKDNGVTWSKAIVVQPVGEFGNQVIRLTNGTLVITQRRTAEQPRLQPRRRQVVGLERSPKTAQRFPTQRQRLFVMPGIHAPIVRAR